VIFQDFNKKIIKLSTGCCPLSLPVSAADKVYFCIKTSFFCFEKKERKYSGLAYGMSVYLVFN